MSDKGTKVADDGVSHSRQLLESARRDNTELLLDIKKELNNDNVKLAALVNNTRELITENTALHLACNFGNWEVIDMLLDIEGVEIDPVNREGDTPLHLAVKYSATEPEHGYFIVDNMLDAGSDPRIRDKDNKVPLDYVSKDNSKLRELLESAEYAISMEASSEEQLDEEDDEEEDEEEGSGSGTGSETE